MGLFGLITFDLFYKTNNTLILHALVAVQHDFGHSQWVQTELDARAVSFGSQHCKCPQLMHVALPLMHEEMCIISILLHMI